MTRVPDAQIFLIKEGRFPITAEVKSSKDCEDFNLQTWLQALIGLDKTDITYGILLAPFEGRIFKLSIESDAEETKYKVLSTVSKTWCLADKQKKFNVSKFIEFMEAILDVLIVIS